MNSLPGFSLHVRCAISAVLALLLSGPSAATSCVVAFTTLADDYADAEGIAVMQAIACADGAVPQSGRCPDDRYELAVIEVLKDSVPSRDRGGIYTGGDPMGCGVPLIIGNTYLLFVTGVGTFSHGASDLLSGDSQMSRKGSERLRVLREYRDGKVGDLSGPWWFADTGEFCSLTHRVGNMGLSFIYGYGESGAYTYTSEPDANGSGDAIFRMKTAEGVDIEVRDVLPGSPKFEPGQLTFRVEFGMDTKTADNSATITVGNASWPLRTSRLELSFPNSSLRHPIVFDGTGSDAANEILAAMQQEPSDVVVKATRTFSLGDEFPSEQDLQMTIKTRSTQIADSAKRFKACMDGSERVPTIE
jgi:hypothetical protein